ncbi:MAG: LamG domain-containing protein, partial [Planctomycetota bacterium]
GDALDASGNDRHGTLMGNAALLDVGLHGGAISFDGSTGYVNVDGYKGVNMDANGVQQEFSISNWVRCTFTSGDREMVTWGTSAGRQRLTWRVHQSTLRTEHAAGNLRGNTVITDGEWHHVALTVAEGANLRPEVTKLYVDGVEDTYKSGSDNPYELTPNVDVRIGMSGPQNGRYFLGDLDDVRIYTRVLDPNEIAELAIRPKSYLADPASGALIEEVSVLLGWTPGGNAVEHDVYFGTVADLGADQLLGRQAANSALATDLQKDTTYYWRVDDVAADGTVVTGDTWSFWVPPRSSYDPGIDDGSKILGTSANLSWSGGFTPIMHNVNFGTDPAALVPVSMMQMDATYDTGELEPDTTYYWRIDEFYGVDTVEGQVWSFSTTPVLPLSADPNLVGQWTFDGDSGGVVLDQSGHGGHAALAGDVQLVAGIDGDALSFDGSGGDYAEATNHLGVPGTQSRTVMAWIKTADYGEIASWGQNVAGQKWIFRVQESNGTLGAIRVEVNGGYQVGSIDVRDDEWHHVAAVLADDGSPDVNEISLYVDGFLENNSASLDEPIATADGVVRIGQSPWGTRPFAGLIDSVRIYDKAFTEDEMRQLHGDLAIAWQPQPEFGANVEVVGVALSWTPGDDAAEHDVYLGTDADAVAAADATDASGIYRGRQAETTLATELLDFDAAYYWRVDEVAADGTVTAGKVWPFSTAADLTIFDEVTPLDYDTSVDPFASEISLDLDPAQDWTDPVGRIAVNYTGNAAPGSVTVDDVNGTTTVTGR